MSRLSHPIPLFIRWSKYIKHSLHSTHEECTIFEKPLVYFISPVHVYVCAWQIWVVLYGIFYIFFTMWVFSLRKSHYPQGTDYLVVERDMKSMLPKILPKMQCAIMAMVHIVMHTQRKSIHQSGEVKIWMLQLRVEEWGAVAKRLLMGGEGVGGKWTSGTGHFGCKGCFTGAVKLAK